MNLKHLFILILGSTLLLSAPFAQSLQAQDQDQESVAEAARKAQEAKKTAPKPAVVFDNDSVSSLKGSISVVGQEPTPPPDQNPDKTKGAADNKSGVQDEAYWRGKFADANKKLADDAHELDVDQRDYNLKQQQYYSDPNTAMKQQYDRSDLTDLKTKIDDLTAKIAQDKQDISDLEDALRQAGGDPGWATPPSAPATSTPEAPAQENSAPPAPTGIPAVPAGQ
jgi:hypothetical protein